jgi:hypothetical protein
MILSHKHKFIFLKTAKTGGTSVEIALSRFCGPDDILTPLSPSQEKMRRRSQARNYALGLGRLGVNLPGTIAHSFPSLSGFYHHMPASQIRNLIGREVWDSYLKFTIERNPWERQVSHYFWRMRGRARQPDFEAFLTSPTERLFHKGRQDNWSIYTIDGRIAVDHIIQYANLEEGLIEICARMGITDRVRLPRANTKASNERPDYREFYSDRTRELVRRWYAKEIATFGYEF